jgi:hypothetical protein
MVDRRISPSVRHLGPRGEGGVQHESPASMVFPGRKENVPLLSDALPISWGSV